MGCKFEEEKKLIQLTDEFLAIYFYFLPFSLLHQYYNFHPIPITYTLMNRILVISVTV